MALHKSLHADKDLTLERPRSVFLRMTGYGIGPGWWIALATFAMCIPVIKDAWFRYVALAFAAVFVARVGAFVKRLRVDYPAFLQYPKGLPFSVNGAAALLENKLHEHPHDWKNASVIVTASPDADAAVIKAVLDLFMRDANDRFYYPGRPIGGASTDPRVKWKRDGLTVSGSANTWVLRDAYRLIDKLVWLQRKQGGIASVTFSCSGGTYNIPRSS